MQEKSRVWSKEHQVNDFILFVVFCVLFGLAAWGTFTVFDIASSINA
jgi:hypothetical protein